MLPKTLSLILIGLILNLAFYPLSVGANQNQDDKDARLAEKVTKEVAKLGVNEKVKVKLKDGTKLKGYLSEIKDQYFVVTNNGQPTTIQYSQAKQVKGDSYPLSRTGKIITTIIVVVVLGILGGIGFSKP